MKHFPDRFGGLVFYMHLILPNDITSVDENMVRPNTDALGRNTGKAISIGGNKIAEEKISYAKFGDHATSLPSTVRFATNVVFKESIQYRYINDSIFHNDFLTPTAFVGVQITDKESKT